MSGMIKVIPPGSFDFGDTTARLVDAHSRGVDRGWMQKRAAVFTREIAELRPEPHHSLIHLISMGSMEAYGFNRNADGFNEKSANFKLDNGKIIKLAGGLMDYHPTFMKYGHVYKHHKNDDPAKSIGSIKAAAYNPEMRRGELIISVPHGLEWDDDLQKLANGKDVPFSMACKVAYDICTACGNRARTRKEYCDHLRDNMSDITKQGNFIGAINDMPAFFDISKVIRPADRIAWSIQKVASLDLVKVGGAELAEMMCVSAPILEIGTDEYSRKLAAADKLAAIEKQVEGLAHGSDNGHLKALAAGCPRGGLDDAAIRTLRTAPLNGALHSLGEAKVALAVGDFFRLVMGPEKYGSMADSIPMVESMLPGMFNRLSKSGEIGECAADSTYDSLHTAIPRSVKELVTKLASDHSLAYEPVKRRATFAAVRGGDVPELVQGEFNKQAAVSKQAQYLCKEYAKYVLSFVKQSGMDELTNRLTVLRNYLRV